MGTQLTPKVIHTNLNHLKTSKTEWDAAKHNTTHKPVFILLFSDVIIITSLYRITMGQKQHAKPFVHLYPLGRKLILDLFGF